MKHKQILAILITVLLSMAGALAAQSTLTMDGTIVSWTDTGLVVKTDAGEQMVALDSATKRNLAFKEGEDVTIEYRRNPMGLVIANAVWPTGEYMKMNKKAESRREGMQDTGGDQEHQGHSQMRSTSTGSSMNEDSDLVIVGTVTRFDDESVILSTADGDRTFVVTPVTRRVFAYKVGDPVAIEYKIGPDQRLMAESIRQGTRDTGGDQEQRRTRASAESWGPGRGLTLVGEVVSANDEALRVRTTTGIENVVLTQGTRMQGEVEKGDRVAVDYVNDSSTGAIIAEQVRLAAGYSAERDKR